MLQNLRPIEIVLLVALVLLLFGAKKLPELAKGVGQSLKIFKKEIRAVQDSDDDVKTENTAQPGNAEPAEPVATSAASGQTATSSVEGGVAAATAQDPQE